MNFIYFLPGGPATLSATEAVAQAGWPDIARRLAGGCSSGPGDFAGESGVFLRARGELIRVDKEKQCWEKVIPDEGSPYWIGFDLEDPPGPVDLAKEKQLWGTDLVLGDGQSWLVPAIHSPQANDSLVPRRMVYRNGQFRHSETTDYEEVCRQAARFWDIFFADKPTPEKLPEEMECFTFFADILAVNYHVGPIEVGMLGLFEANPLWFQNDFLPAVFGITELMRQMKQKKRESGSAAGNGTATSNGVPASPPATDPISAT